MQNWNKKLDVLRVDIRKRKIINCAQIVGMYLRVSKKQLQISHKAWENK